MPGEDDFDVLGIGTISVDYVLAVDCYPRADDKAEVLEATRHCGGQVATALAAGAALGARCAVAGVLGDDELSAFARTHLRRAGVNCDNLLGADDARPIHSVIIADAATGGRTIFYSRCGARPPPAETIDRRLIGRARILLIDQSHPDSKIAAAGIARDIGVPVVADMEWPDEPRVEQLMARIDHLILPRSFAAGVTGADDPADMVRAAAERWPGACTAVTCGRDGCYWSAPGSGEVRHRRALDVPTAQTIGCGDVFHGAYAAALADGMDVAACVDFASAAAAVYASRPNGWVHLPTRADVADLIGRQKD